MRNYIRIMIADDQAVVRWALRRTLESHDGLTVVGEAHDGEMAIDLAETLAPDVVLMDYDMPQKTGQRQHAPSSLIIHCYASSGFPCIQRVM